ncbi:MAG: tetratricopeptide repeat protein [Cellvibrionaceae bacterium]
MTFALPNFFKIICSKILTSIVFVVFFSACSAIETTHIAPPAKVDLEQILIPPEGVSEELLSEPEVDLLGLSPAMKKFVDTYVPKKGTREEKLEKLFDAISYNPDYKIQYDARATLTGADVFKTQRGNCLAFSAMFIALAREAGLVANFQQVDVPPSWDALSDEVLIQYRHVNAKIQLKYGRDGVIDFRIDRYSETYPRQILSDDMGLALYYSNISMQHVVEGDFARAYVASKRALEADSSTAFIWNNMGIVQRRLGNLSLAEASYRQALQLNPYDWSALNNLAFVFDKYNEKERADELRQLSDKYKLRDPYYRYALAQYSYRKGDYNEVIELLDVSVSKRRSEHRFYYLRGLAYWEQGDKQRAISDVKKAIKVSKNSSFTQSNVLVIQARYERTLDSWEAQPKLKSKG